MAHVVRHTPFEVADPVDALFRGFFRPIQTEKDLPQMRIDVTEDDKTYTVQADMPGVAKDDIHVTIDGHTVSISAETRTHAELRDGERVLRRERTVGRVSRSFTLEHEVDESTAQAKYQDGVLELTLPKKIAATVRRLAIQ